MTDLMRAEFGVEFSAKQLDVSVSGYYKSRNRTVSLQQAARWDLSAKILGAFVASGRAHGHRKIHHTLVQAGVVVGRKTVAARMREMRLVPLATQRAFKRAAARKRTVPDPVDLLERKMHGIRRSMGARYECCDYAVAESFFSKLKGERLDWTELPTRQAATREVTDYVHYFNTVRSHQTLGYRTSAAMLKQKTEPAPIPVAA